MPLTDSLDQLKARYERSRAPAFLAWWGRELAGLVPASWRRLLARGESRLLLRSSAAGLQLVSFDEAGSVVRATVPADRAGDLQQALERSQDERPRWLLLPAGAVLRRRLVLPLAASGRLRELLAHEVDRQTPFRADQVVFDCRVLGRDAAAGKLDAELVVVPLARLDSAVSALGPLAGELRGVDVEDGSRTLGVNLLPAGRRAARRDRLRWIHLGLLLAILAGAWFTLWQSLENRRAAVAELRDLVEQRQLDARRVGALRDQLDAATGGASFLAGVRARQPRALEVIDDVSRRLPDGTWLDRLTINQGRISLIGLSNEASGTIGWLQDSPYLESPALSGAVQPDPQTGAQRFTLTAGLTVPEAGP